MEVEHYAVIGGLMFTCFLVGGSMISNEYSPPVLITVGNYMITGGWILLLVLAGFGGYAILQRVREWNVDRRYDSIDRKFEHLELKKQERELKRKEREYKEEQERKEREYRQRQKEQELRRQAEMSSSDMHQSSQQQNPSEPQNYSDKNTHSAEDDSVLRTGGTTDKLNKPQAESDSGYTDHHYRKLIDDEMELKILWTLYKEPDNYQNRHQLYKSFNEESDRSKKFNKCMENLVDLGLIEKNQIKPDDRKDFFNKTKESYVPILTFRGTELIKTARIRKITTWDVFLEEFKLESGE